MENIENAQDHYGSMAICCGFQAHKFQYTDRLLTTILNIEVMCLLCAHGGPLGPFRVPMYIHIQVNYALKQLVCFQMATSAWFYPTSDTVL
jgi:hypothetical protein